MDRQPSRPLDPDIAISKAAPPFQSIASTPRKDQEGEVLDKTDSGSQLQTTKGLQVDPSPHRIIGLPHPATQPHFPTPFEHSFHLTPRFTATSYPQSTSPTMKPHNQHSTIPPASNRPSTSHHSSVQAWLDQALQAPPTPEDSSAAQTLSQCDRQNTSLKRKRSASSDPRESDHTIPLTRKALKQHLALTRSSGQSTLLDVCTITHSINDTIC